MNEYSGAVLRAQLRKLDRIAGDFRSRSARVKQGIADLPGIQFRKSNDPSGALGSSVYFRTTGKEERDRFIKALRAENIPAGTIEGSVLLPLEPYIEKKQTLEPGWPSFATVDGKALRFGAECCPRTIDVWNRYVGVPMDPTYSDQDVSDIIAAVRKVYPAIAKT